MSELRGSSRFADLRELAGERLKEAKSVTLENSVKRRIIIQTDDNDLRITVIDNKGAGGSVTESYLLCANDTLLITVNVELPTPVEHVTIKLQPFKQGFASGENLGEWRDLIRLLSSLLRQQDYAPVRDVT